MTSEDWNFNSQELRSLKETGTNLKSLSHQVFSLHVCPLPASCHRWWLWRISYADTSTVFTACRFTHLTWPASRHSGTHVIALEYVIGVGRCLILLLIHSIEDSNSVLKIRSFGNILLQNWCKYLIIYSIYMILKLNIHFAS